MTSLGSAPRHSPGWYDQAAWVYDLREGDRMFIRCDSGPCSSRLELFPPRLEISEGGGTYVLTDDGPPWEWHYTFLAAR